MNGERRLVLCNLATCAVVCGEWCVVSGVVVGGVASGMWCGEWCVVSGVVVGGVGVVWCGVWGVWLVVCG